MEDITNQTSKLRPWKTLSREKFSQVIFPELSAP